MSDTLSNHSLDQGSNHCFVGKSSDAYDSGLVQHLVRPLVPRKRNCQIVKLSQTDSNSRFQCSGSALRKPLLTHSVTGLGGLVPEIKDCRMCSSSPN